MLDFKVPQEKKCMSKMVTLQKRQKLSQLSMKVDAKSFIPRDFRAFLLVQLDIFTPCKEK